MAKRVLTLDTKEIEYLLQAVGNYTHDGPDVVFAPLLRKLNNNLKTITVASRKGKGRDLQKWVCSEISEITGIPYTQSDDQCEIHSREMGQAGTDIVLRGEAFKKFPWSVECKNSESLDLVGTVSQAATNVSPGTRWLIVHKRKALSENIVIMAWDAFKALMKGRQ